MLTNDVPDLLGGFDDGSDGFEELIGDLPDGTRRAMSLRAIVSAAF